MISHKQQEYPCEEASPTVTEETLTNKRTIQTMKTQTSNSKSNMRPQLSPVPVTTATSATELTDALLKQISTMPAGRLAQLLARDMVTAIPRRLNISSFDGIAGIDVVDIHPLPDQVYVCFDFHLQETHTKAGRKLRTIKGDATIIYLPEKKALLDINYAKIDPDDSAVAATPLPVIPAHRTDSDEVAHS